MSTLNQLGSKTTISVVHPRDLSSGTSQTSGSLRMSAISATQGVASPLWAGIFVVEPSARTSIHHHGEQDTIVYVLEGESFVRWGDHGEHSATAKAGDFLHVPAWLPHQEINLSSKTAFRWVVVRSLSAPTRTATSFAHLPRRPSINWKPCWHRRRLNSGGS